jgi:hypothetical protein
MRVPALYGTALHIVYSQHLLNSLTMLLQKSRQVSKAGPYSDPCTGIGCISTDIQNWHVPMFSNSLIQQHNAIRLTCHITIKVVSEDSSCSMSG